MSSPRNKSYGPGEIREGTRVVLKEITASLHNSPVKQTSPRKSNDPGQQKSPEHAVKVQFAREFADAKKISPSVTESLSSASSFQSLTSTLSSKSSSGICVDSAPVSPSKSANTSYVNSDIPGLDDLINACAGIKISPQGEQPDIQLGLGDLSQDQTFSSAVDDFSIVEDKFGESFTEELKLEESFQEPSLKEQSFKEQLEHSLKEQANLNETFDRPASDPPEKSLTETQDLSTYSSIVSSSINPVNSNSTAPFISFDDSVVKSHGLHAADSSVFSTALDFGNLAGFPPKVVEENKSNDTQNDSVTNSDSTNVEFGFNASIESQKNVSLINTNQSFEKISSPSPLLSGISNDLTTPRNDESCHNDAPPEPETDPVPSACPIILEESIKVPDISEGTDNLEAVAKGVQEVLENFEGTGEIAESSKESEDIPENLNRTREIPEILNTTQEIPKILNTTQEITENLNRTQEVPEILNTTQEIPKILNTTQEIPEILNRTRELSESLNKTQEIVESSQNIQEIANSSIETKKIVKDVPVELEASVKVAEEIVDNSQEIKEIADNSQEIAKVVEIPETSDLSSTFPIIPDEVQPDIPEKVTFAGDETKIHSFVTEKISKLPIPQSILDKVAEQQKALDDSNEETCQLPDEKSPEEYSKRYVKLSPIIETSPDSETFQEKNSSSTVRLENSPQGEGILVNGRRSITKETGLNGEKLEIESEELRIKDKEILTNIEEIITNEISITSKNSPGINVTVESPSEIVFLKEKTLESTVICQSKTSEQIPDIIVFSPPGFCENVPSNTVSNLLEKKEESENSNQATEYEFQFEVPQTVTPKRTSEKIKKELTKRIEDIKNIDKTEGGTISEIIVQEELNSTVILDGSEIDLEALDSNSARSNVVQEENYEAFKPQQQSTNLAFADPFIYDKVELEAQAIAKEIYDKSLEIADDNEQFISATSELFQDPTGFDFLLSQGSSNSRPRDVRFESLYVKFDPLINTSMLPQGNSQTENEEQKEKNELPAVPSANTPKRNPAIAAIDRLLFYSPITTENKIETKDSKQEESEPVQDIPVVDEKMAKELELVRSSVVELQEQLEKLQKEREDDAKKYQKDIKKQHDEFKKLEERNNRVEAQLAQEVESKKQVTVVLDEYERSLSRMLAERERDRSELEEKARMKEELQAASQHLSNTEAAFNDVHQKYERLKGVVAAYKSNEAVLKESVQENEETIRGLGNRYEQLKSHAMAQLEKANHELETIRKQNEAETVKLQALLKKAELKSKSLTDLVEQKTKENKELTQILDDLIARVGMQNSE